MKTFKEYLSESVKTYPFRIKVAGDMTAEDEGTLKYALEKFSIAEFKKVGKTPIQSLPLDFPKVRNTEVNVYEVSTHYPTTPQELSEKLMMCLKRPLENIIVRNPGDPLEEYQQPHEKREGALLTDGEYKEAGDPKFDSFWGANYNAKFLQGLHTEAEARRKALGEVIPEGSQEVQSTEASAGSSLLKPAPDPRKK
jgi:hypothetical protein